VIQKIINGLVAGILRILAVKLVKDHWLKLDAALVMVCRSASCRDFGSLPLALIYAEDRRFLAHGGIDIFGIARAAYRMACGGRLEGASTITQQLVRTVSGKYELSLRRKFGEILLAVLVDAKYSKREQIAAYLEVAYFGWKMNGIEQAMKRLGYAFPPRPWVASQGVARLKYPQPKAADALRLNQISARADMIMIALSKASNGDASHEIQFNRT
jgi:hypothetical protein